MNDILVSSGTKLWSNEADYIFHLNTKIYNAPRLYTWVEYNQTEVQTNSCSIHWCISAATALTWYLFNLADRITLWDMALDRGGSNNWWWYLSDATKLIRDFLKTKDISLKYFSVNYRDYDTILDAWYVIITGYRVLAGMRQDRIDNWILDGSAWRYWEFSNGHCIAINKKNWKVYCIDNYKGSKYNLFEIKDLKKLCEDNVFFKSGFFYIATEQLRGYQYLTLKEKINKLRNRVFWKK